GTGYAAMGKPSPYLWSGTDQYVRGKYVADHQFDADAVDKQLGCAPLIAAMRRRDSSIRFDGEAPRGGLVVAGGAVLTGAASAAAGAAGLSPIWGFVAVGAVLALAALGYLWWGKHHG